MLRDAVESPGEHSPGGLRRAYDELLADTVRAVGVATVADRSGVGSDRLDALRREESPPLTVREAATILAADPDRPDADTLAAEARDILLIEMSTAVLDVETLAATIDGDRDPKTLQQKIEGRQSLSLGEYALLYSHIAGQT